MFVQKSKSLRFPVVPQGPLSRKQRDDLFQQMLRVPRVFDETINRLNVDRHFKDDAELEHRVLLAACRDVHAKYGAKPGDKSFRKRLRAQIKDVLDGMGEEVLPEERSEILGAKSTRARAFAAKGASANEQYGLDLLKRFLMEKEVFDPLADAFTQCKGDNQKPENLGGMLSEATKRLTAIESLDLPDIKSIGEERQEHQKRLKYYRDRKIVGLKTGLKELDRRTLGLRGTFVFGAKPGAGKTGFCAVEIPLGICRHHQDNEAVVVVVSLDMDRFELYNRVDCNLADIEWLTLTFGSPTEDREPGSDFSKTHLERLNKGEERFKTEQVDKRLVVLDRAILGENITAERLAAIVRTTKAKCNATRALLVVDYLQLLPVPDDVASRGDLTADKYRVRMIQQAIAGTRTETNPLGDTVLAISEARKPQTSKDAWGQSLSELMGSARLPYAADGVLLYRPMDYKEMQHYYDVPMTKDYAATYRQILADNGIAPLMLILDKGRDGMIRGEWGIEFHFRKTRFRELEHGTGTHPNAYDPKNLPPHLHNLGSESATKTSTANGGTVVLPPTGHGAKPKSKKHGTSPKAGKAPKKAPTTTDGNSSTGGE